MTGISMMFSLTKNSCNYIAYSFSTTCIDESLVELLFELYYYSEYGFPIMTYGFFRINKWSYFLASFPVEESVKIYR